MMRRFFDVPKLFLIHLSASYSMIGIITALQFFVLPVYSIFSQHDISSFQNKFIFHYGLIIGSIMLIEMISALILARNIINYELHRYIRGNIAILIAIWIVTFIFEIPSHFAILNQGINDRLLNAITFANIFKLSAWILKSIYVTKMTKILFAYEGAYLDDFLETTD